MRANPRNRIARRTLLALCALLVLLFGGIGAAHVWGSPKAELTPLLGLDLAGGRQIVIEPVIEGGGVAEPQQVDQAIDIIRRRIDGGGVSEAEVSRLGSTNIVVSIPGSPSPGQLEALSRSSLLRFRAVLVAEQTLPQPTAPPTPTRELPFPTAPQPPAPQLPSIGTPGSTDGAPPGGAPSAPAATTNGAYPEGLLAAGGATAATPTGPTATPPAPTAPADTDQNTSTQGPETTPTPTSDSDLAWITPQLQQEFAQLQCDDKTAQAAADADPAKPVVTCSTDGSEKYILGPSELSGADITDASSGLEVGQGGQPTGAIEVRLSLNQAGTDAFREITSRLMGFPKGAAQNRFAMVLDGLVISAPGVNAIIPNGQASITGNFDSASGAELANQLKFGALPISFAVQTSEQVSPTLGSDQLRTGIIAGLIGLLLVFLYSLLQYRALGLVTIGSLAIAALFAYGLVTLLGWANNFRLTMAGVTGLIVAIGITADSFIVYFERVRDEVRAGRPLRYAVDTGWARARRTILISDVVNLIAAAVLYWLSESGVKAFAFALGLTTLIDLMVVFLFTHPVVSMLANTKFFGQGHKWSGMDPEHLGAKRATYLGRGRFADPVPKLHTGPTREQLEGGIV